ncbi:MAG TPA: hypothetical protein ENK28_06335 [Aliiroseovarius sp.]|nr:hypothetical protein [Aliiroseovarius sp.]
MTGRIYATGPDLGAWHCLLSPDAPAPDGCVELAPGIYAGRGAGQERDGFLWLPGDSTVIPHWLTHGLVPDPLAEALRRFEARLQQLAPALSDELSPLDVAAIRGLVVHEWRRLLLRCPDLPDHLFGENNPIAPCRALVGQTLARLGPVALADLAP